MDACRIAVSAVLLPPTGAALLAELLIALPDEALHGKPNTPGSRRDLGAAVVQLVRTHQQELDLNQQLAAANDQLHGVNQGLLTTQGQ